MYCQQYNVNPSIIHNMENNVSSLPTFAVQPGFGIEVALGEYSFYPERFSNSAPPTMSPSVSPFGSPPSPPSISPLTSPSSYTPSNPQFVPQKDGLPAKHWRVHNVSQNPNLSTRSSNRAPVKSSKTSKTSDVSSTSDCSKLSNFWTENFCLF